MNTLCQIKAGGGGMANSADCSSRMRHPAVSREAGAKRSLPGGGSRHGGRHGGGSDRARRVSRRASSCPPVRSRSSEHSSRRSSDVIACMALHGARARDQHQPRGEGERASGVRESKERCGWMLMGVEEAATCRHRTRRTAQAGARALQTVEC